MASSSSRQNSRFSTLKVFKFGASAAKPPPPPPKDPYYLPNHSLASLHQPSSSALSPPSTTQPATPTSATPYSSAGYASSASSARSPSPTSSYHMPSYAPSFATSRTTLAPSSGSIISPEPTSEPSSSRKGFFKFSSLGKRPKTPRSSSSTSTNSSEPLSDTVEDPGISRPWNFQHNVHVDEAFVGLPPTWSASLAEMGFSEEEIDNIHARRAASKTTLYALRPERPDSPASSMYSARSRTAPPLHPPPRRDFDSMSRNSEFSYASRNLSLSTDADPSVAEDTASVYTMSRRLAQSPETTYASASQFPYPPSSLPGIQTSTPLSKDSRPRTPTKRVYHVVNDSVSTISPPPAYTSSQRDSFLTPFAEQSESVADGLDTASLSAFGDRRSEAVIGAEAEDEVGELNGDSSPSSSDRTSKLPPRLSLHQDTFSDLSSWTESLFSIIPEAPVKQAGAAETSSSAAEGSSSSTVAPSKASASSRMSSVSARHRTLPPQKPLPAHVLPGGHTTPSSPTPPPPPLPLSSSNSSADGDLWDEVYGMVRTPEQDSQASPKPPPSPTHETSDELSVPQAESRPSSSELKVEFTRDNRDSNLSTMTVTPATIVRHVSVVKRTRANIIKSPPPRSDSLSSMALSTDGEEVDDKASARSGRSTSPMSSDSNDSDASSMGVSITSGSEPVSSSSSRPTTLSVGDMQKWKGSDIKSATIPYVETSPQPSPLAAEFNRDNIITQATVRNFRESEEASGIMQRPSILIDNMPVPENGNAGSPWSAMTPSPATPALRYAGWVTEVVSPIKEFIDDTVDPRDLYADLQEVAEGESGSVFAARVVRSANAQDYVAIKQVALLPSGSQKLVDLERELRLVKHLRHPNVLSMDMLYVDLVEDSLWISMELMDRSLADVLNLVEEGVRVEEKYISCFAKDTLTALNFLQSHGISHRDVRSDNLLVNHSGVVKLADFSNAVKVLPNQPLCDEPAGVIYWQAPEMRSGRYDPLKVDVWSLGATVWELAQAEPPFADVTDPSQMGDTLPPLDSPESFSRSFHEFLQLCSQPRSSRPDPEDLLDTPFVRNAHDRSVVAELLLRCRSTEEDLAKRLSVVSQGTVCP